ncbi:transposase family protein [Nonomuraea sp. NPDC004702]
MVVRWFRGEHDIPKLGRDHRVSRATAYRHIHEGIEVLAAQAPDPSEALDRAHTEGLAFVILDGTLIPIDRRAERTTSLKGESIDVWYSGKARQHAGNPRVLSSPGGLPLWIAEAEPGSVHDLSAARAQVLAALYAAATRGLPALADSDYDGAGVGIHTPSRRPEGNQILSPDNHTYNRLLRSLRSLGAGRAARSPSGRGRSRLRGPAARARPQPRPVRDRRDLNRLGGMGRALVCDLSVDAEGPRLGHERENEHHFVMALSASD